MARVLMLSTSDFEDSELREPLDRLREAGHEVMIAGPEQGEEIEGKRGDEKVTVEMASDDVDPDEFAALVIPGGYSPDKLRLDDASVRITREMVQSGKPVAAICHAPSLLIEAGVVEGRKLTSWPSVRTDLVNAGAEWVDEELVVDGNLITSRKPDDLDAFCDGLLTALREREPAGAGR